MASIGVEPDEPASNLLRLELLQVDLMKLHEIDISKSTFKAQIWIEFKLKDGALDEHLSKEGAVFPIGADGEPTFRPSAGWYQSMVDFRSAIAFRVVDAKILKRGTDLHLAMRYEGTFAEVFELGDFPFDNQGLTIVLNFNCRVGGELPIELTISPQCAVTLSCIDVCPPAREWDVATHLNVRALSLGAEYGSERVFPALAFTAEVRRKPLYHVLNLALPMGCFSLLSLLQALVDNNSEGSINHRAQLTLMMVLTASAYKMAIAGKLPPISYLTWLDRYTLANFMLIIVVAVQSRALSQLSGDGEKTGVYDYVTTGMLGAVWVFIHVHYAWKAYKRVTRAKKRDANVREGTVLEAVSRLDEKAVKENSANAKAIWVVPQA